MEKLDYKSTLKGHQGAIYKLAYDYSTQALFSAGGDGWIVKWDLTNPNNDGLLIAKSESQVFALAMIPDANLIVVGCINGDLNWIDYKSNEILKKHNLSSFAIYDIIVEGDFIYSCSADGYFTKWDPLRMKPILSLAVSNVALRKAIYDTENNCFLIGSSDGNIYKVDKAFTSSEPLIMNAHEPSTFCLLKVKDKLISGGRDAKIKEWDIDAKTMTNSIDAHWFTVNDMLLMDSQKLLVSASRDKNIRVWDSLTLSPKFSIKPGENGHKNSVNTLCYVQDLNFLVSGGDDRSIILHELSH